MKLGNTANCVVTLLTMHVLLAAGGSSLVTAQRLTVSKQANYSEMRRRHRETADGTSVGIKMRERHASKGSMSQPAWGAFHCYQQYYRVRYAAVAAAT